MLHRPTTSRSFVPGRLAVLALCSVAGCVPQNRHLVQKFAPPSATQASSPSPAQEEQLRWEKPPANDPDPRTIAVLELELPEPRPDAPLDSTQAARVQVERWLIPAELTAELARRHWASEAHTASFATPAVDLLVRGRILASDQESIRLALTVEPPGGEALFTLDVNHTFTTTDLDRSTLSRLCRRIVNRMAHHLAGAPGKRDFVGDRVTAYAEQPGLASVEEARSLAEQFAAAERNHLLTPLSEVYATAMEEQATPYHEWRRRSVRTKNRIAELEREAAAAKQAAEAARTESHLWAGLQVVLGAAAQSQGAAPDFGFLDTLREGRETAMDSEIEAAKAEREAATLAQNAEELTASLEAEAEATSIEVDGQIYSTAGRLADQVEQLRRIAGERLRSLQPVPQ